MLDGRALSDEWNGTHLLSVFAPLEDVLRHGDNRLHGLIQIQLHLLGRRLDRHIGYDEFGKYFEHGDLGVVLVCNGETGEDERRDRCECQLP